MISHTTRLFAVVILSTILFAVSACSGGKYLRAVPIHSFEEITGNFTVILFGTAEYDGLETVAFLDREGDSYEVVPHAPDFQYSASMNNRGKEAFEKALHFISSHHAYNTYQIRRILDRDMNRTIGYEVRPLYLPFVYGYADVLYVDYWFTGDGSVSVSIKLKRSVEDHILGIGQDD